MNCQDAEKWLSARLDGELDSRHITALVSHLQACAACRETDHTWQKVGQHLRAAEVPGAQTPEAAWQDVQRALRGEKEKPARSPLLGPGMWMWAAPGLAILVLGLGLYFTGPSGIKPVQSAESVVGVEYVETGLPGASSMVYVDEDSGMSVVWVVEADAEIDNGAG